MGPSKIDRLIIKLLGGKLTEIDGNYLKESGFSHRALKGSLSKILKENSFINENSNEHPEYLTKFTSDSQKGIIHLAHFHEAPNYDGNYFLVYAGVKKETVNSIEEKIKKKPYIRVL